MSLICAWTSCWVRSTRTLRLWLTTFATRSRGTEYCRTFRYVSAVTVRGIVFDLHRTQHVPLADSPWFSLSSLRLAIDSYFAAFHSQFPLLHRPTFDPSLTSSHQLLLLVLIGQAHFTTPVTEFAHLSPFVRAKLTLFLSPDMSLDILQTLLLCSFYDEFMSSTSAQVAAQCFSATLVSIARRNSMMVRRGTSASTAAGTGLSLSSMERWKAWVSEELFARAAFALIYLDSQLSASWGQVCGRRCVQSLKLTLRSILTSNLLQAYSVRHSSPSSRHNCRVGSHDRGAVDPDARRRSPHSDE